jgi:hypothetical protein
VGDDEARSADNEVSVEQDVEVKGARAVGEAAGAVTAKVLFDEEQGAEQFEGSQAGFEGGSSIEKAGLIGESDRRGGVEGGTGRDAAKGFKARRCGSQGGLGRAYGAGQVRAHSDVSGVHPASGYREVLWRGWCKRGLGNPNLLASLLEIYQDGCTH